MTLGVESDRNPVLLVHGLNDTIKVFDKLANYLTDLGWSVHRLNLIPNNGSAQLEDLANQVAVYIEQSFDPHRPLDLLGFSMGGLVTRYYLQRMGGVERVQRYINISAPNNGTLTAYALPLSGIVQMRPESSFLQDLNSDAVAILQRIQTTIFWTPLDLMIVPAKSSQLFVGQERTIPVLLHPWMLTDQRMLKAIAQILSEPIPSPVKLSMESLSQKIFELLAGFAETDADREVYLNALGSENLVETEEERHERLLRQLRQGEYAAALKAYLQLMAIADDDIQRQLREIVRERVYSSATDEQLRTELVAYFKPPRILDAEDVRVLLASCPDWFTEKNIARAHTIQAVVAQRCEEELFRKQVIDVLKEISSHLRSSNAAYALIEALRNPLCALDVVRLMPSFKDQTSFQEVFKKLLVVERQGIDLGKSVPVVLLKQQCPVTCTLVRELIAVGAEGEIGSLITMLLASSAEPTVVVRLVQETD
jgi:alpha/beta superfamily hydrolase